MSINYRDIWEAHHGRKIKKDHHIHHIDGNRENNNVDNLLEVSIEEHAQIHYDLYEKHGRIKDFIAWKGLSNRKITEEDRKKLAKEAYIEYTKTERFENTKKKLSILYTGTTLPEETKTKISKSLKKAYDEGRKEKKPIFETYEEQLKHYEKNKAKMERGRKSSKKWRDSVTNEEYKALKREQMLNRDITWGDKISSSKRGKETKSTISVEINGVSFPSIAEASRQLDIPASRLRYLFKKQGEIITL